MSFVSPSIHRSIATLCFGYVDASTGISTICTDPVTKKVVPCTSAEVGANYQWVGYVVGGITVLNGLFNMFILYSHPGFRTSGVGMDSQGKGAPAAGVGSLQVSSGGQLACCKVLSRVPPDLLHSCAGLFSPIESPRLIISLILPPRHILRRISNYHPASHTSHNPHTQAGSAGYMGNPGPVDPNAGLFAAEQAGGGASNGVRGASGEVVPVIAWPICARRRVLVGVPTCVEPS